jgi:DNA-binding beta-propeller fold protein YncE
VSIGANGDETMNRIGTAATLCLALMVGACGTSGKPGGSSQPAATREAARTTTPAGPAVQLVLRDGDGSGATPYAVVDGRDGRLRSSLPAGVPAPDWHVLYASHQSGASTIVRAIDPTDGAVRRAISVAGAWQLPSIGLDRWPGGLSADGGTLVLVETTAGGSATAASTRFAIVSTAGQGVPRVITLPGRLTFDAMSPDGGLLYVLDHVTDGSYSVRQVDVASGRMAEGSIVDKRNPGEPMAGYAVTQLPGVDGWVYTIYRSADGAFIHALDTQHGGAFCIDLPGANESDEAGADRWGLALDATRQVLYAANGALGIVDEVSLDTFMVSRMKKVAAAESSATLVKIGPGDRAGGGQIATSPDGSTLYLVGERGVLAVRRSDLRPAGRLGDDRTYRGLAMSGAGDLYVVDDTGALSRLDPVTGHVSAYVDRRGFTAIVAILAVP